jgi:hypothetical protein
LTNLNDLENLIYIGGNLSIFGNKALTSIAGLENIDPANLKILYIENNANLTDCAIKSICEIIANPNDTIMISNNATGCNSQDEVKDACNKFSISDLYSDPFVSVYPNPVENELTIQSRNGVMVTDLIIYNQFGQKEMYVESVHNSIDVSGLHPGFYIFELIVGDKSIRKGLIKR